MSARNAGWIAGALLILAYAATLAPDVTFWDAGEFIAAAHSLGIPHPPGTPLYILLLNAWARVLPVVSFAVATNLFSAVCTAVGVVLAARLAAQSGDGDALDGWFILASALCAGAMTSVWLNATETEVYAASLAMVIVTLICADRAGRTESPRWRALVAYLIVLAVPLHLSALVGAPAAIYLASVRRDGGWSLQTAVALTGTFVLAMGLGKMSAALVVVGVSMVAVAPLVPRLRPAPDSAPDPAGLLILVGVGVSVLAVLIVRARHDPTLNQGAPTTLAWLADVVARRQYAVPGMWPRGAPLWLQLTNWFEYADWQFALSLGPTVIPTVARTAVTLLFAVLGVAGAMSQRKADPRGWRALALLFACGSIGVVAYLNLRAGPSFGWGFLPEGSLREARERDYFFVLGFLVWGLWAGRGAMALARARRWHPGVGVALGALPLALNWTAVSRRMEPVASLPRQFAETILGSAPPRAVLFVDGDNDSYPLWFAQEVLGVRRDVTTVTVPLLGTDWYERELSRRFDLVPRRADGTPMVRVSVAEIADRARALGRPVAAAMSVPARTRNRLGARWQVRGMVYTEDSASNRSTSNLFNDAKEASSVRVDSAVTREWSTRIERWRAGRRVPPSIDPIAEWALGVLDCPRLMLEAPSGQARLDSLASTCNRR